MSPPPLNNDVLRHILSYLHGRDALHVALCSKRLHSLALPRIPAVAHIADRADLQRTHAYMLSGAPAPRAHFLEDLSVDLPVFDYPEDDPHAPFSDYWDFSLAPLVGDLLLRAQRLRWLALERLHPCLEADPRIGAALATMDRLRAATFVTVADGTFALMVPLPGGLRQLELVYFWAEDDPLEAEAKTLPPLLEALAPLRHLHTLQLHHFQPPDGSLGRPPPTLSSLRTLRLAVSSSHALELVALCPNLESLTYSLAQHSPADPLPEGPRWPHLRILALQGYREVGCLVNRVGTVQKLCIIGALEIGSPEEAADVRDLLAILARTSPVGLRLHVALGSKPIAFWGKISAAAPRLRGLELVVSLAPPVAENESWLDIIPNALKPLRLDYLSVEMLKGKTERASQPIPNGPPQDSKYSAEAQGLDEHRTRSIDKLPPKLAAAIPSLRFLSLSAAVSKEAGPVVRSDNGGSGRAVLSGARSRDVGVRYWRITREDGAAVLHPLAAVEAERVRVLMVHAQFEGLSSI